MTFGGLTWLDWVNLVWFVGFSLFCLCWVHVVMTQTDARSAASASETVTYINRTVSDIRILLRGNFADYIRHY